MSKISDELREFIDDEDLYPSYIAELRRIADRIDSEMVERPRDADGKPIHVGETLDGYGKTIEVVEMRHGRGGWVLISRDGSGYADTFAFAHHHEPTVEDVLREFTDEGKAGGGKGPLVQTDMSGTIATGNDQTMFVPIDGVGYAVRRLTPTECERLQGFPDGWTDVPFKGREHPGDTPRYKAIGNSMAVPVMRWIGERIQMADKMEVGA